MISYWSITWSAASYIFRILLCQCLFNVLLLLSQNIMLLICFQLFMSQLLSEDTWKEDVTIHLALLHDSFHTSQLWVYMSCWIWRLLQWYGTCPCYEMIHLQVCLSASQASSRSFSPPLPRWAKAPHLLRLQRRCLTFLPYDFASQGVSVFPFESQPNRLWWRLCVLHESTAFHWGKYACICSTGYDRKWERTQDLASFKSLSKKMMSLHILLNYVELSVL